MQTIWRGSCIRLWSHLVSPDQVEEPHEATRRPLRKTPLPEAPVLDHDLEQQAKELEQVLSGEGSEQNLRETQKRSLAEPL